MMVNVYNFAVNFEKAFLTVQPPTSFNICTCTLVLRMRSMLVSCRMKKSLYLHRRKKESIIKNMGKIEMIL